MYGPSTGTELTVILGSGGVGIEFGFVGGGDSWAKATDTRSSAELMQSNRSMEDKRRRVSLFTRGTSQSKNSAESGAAQKKHKCSPHFGNFPAPSGNKIVVWGLERDVDGPDRRTGANLDK